MKRPSGVAADRVLALGSILSGTFLMVVVLAVPKGAVVVAILAASLVTLIVVTLRLIHHTRRGALHEQVRLSARLPSSGAAAAFLAYAAILSAVHHHIVDTQVAAYGRAVSRLSTANKAADHADTKATNTATSAVGHLLHALRTLNASQKFEFVRGLGRAKHLLTELKRGQDLLAFKAVTSALPLDRPTRSSLLRDLNLAIAAKRREARADLNYRTAIPGKAPALDAVPAWFAQLARFFQLSVQLLAAMTIALVFTRRGRLENVEEQRLGIAMLFAFVGGLGRARRQLARASSRPSGFPPRLRGRGSCGRSYSPAERRRRAAIEVARKGAAFNVSKALVSL